jgi:hypothetical protein
MEGIVATIESVFILCAVLVCGLIHLNYVLHENSKQLRNIEALLRSVTSGSSRQANVTDEVDEDVMALIKNGDINKAVALYFSRKGGSLRDAELTINRLKRV